ncbi:hypothetical protein [Actinophytocola xinjiangensis]|uniref:hypothetical protein n=1 Tax=Actinophytocola xinjiangensis TaxID=485602 RepID=UPI000A5F1A6B|nr:hypothetical protein [Actinophytocola xinjiangensis]
MTGTFAEYRELSITDPLRQGDVLEAVDPSRSKWQRHLLVLTADCDFAYDKHQGRVTCVPVLAATEYLLEMQVPRLREKSLAKILRTLRAELTGVGANISDERLRAWPCEVEPAKIITSIGLDGPAAETVGASLRAIRLLSQPTTSLGEAVDQIVTAQLVMSDARTRDAVIRQTVSQLRGPYSQPPGDTLFLSAIARNHDIGYFVYLRHLEQVWQPEIAIGPARRAVSYRRISRLQDRYIHSIVQRFALVFLSIGLPKEYEEMRDLHAELLEETFR